MSLIALALKPFAHEFTNSAGRFGSFARPALRWLFISPPVFHFAENAFTLKLLFQNPQRLIHIVVSNGDVHVFHIPSKDCWFAVATEAVFYHKPFRNVKTQAAA